MYLHSHIMNFVTSFINSVKFSTQMPDLILAMYIMVNKGYVETKHFLMLQFKLSLGQIFNSMV